MKKKRERSVRVSIPEAEREVYGKLAERMGISVTELVRRCTFSDFEDDTAAIKSDDCFELMETMHRQENAVDSFCALLMETDPSYHSEVIQINDKNEVIQRKAIEIYHLVEKMRVRVKKYAVKKMLGSQIAFAEADILKGRHSAVRIMMTEDEFNQITAESESRSMSISAVMRLNVMGKCLINDLFVDSYPLNELNRTLDILTGQMSERIYNLCGQDISADDVEWIHKAMSEIEEALDAVVIPTDQKDTRREANRIVSYNNAPFIQNMDD
ncbi:MAG: hypothetical protein IJ899_13430 [Blautia sp.]|nr:hypothetical protein [Blautia sp.]